MAYQTKHCIRCQSKAAKHVCGHVLHGKEHVLAGWCDRCWEGFGQHMSGGEGWRGHWTRAMGKKEWHAR